jgi:hypothetical protein
MASQDRRSKAIRVANIESDRELHEGCESGKDFQTSLTLLLCVFPVMLSPLFGGWVGGVVILSAVILLIVCHIFMLANMEYNGWKSINCEMY